MVAVRGESQGRAVFPWSEPRHHAATGAANGQPPTPHPATPRRRRTTASHARVVTSHRTAGAAIEYQTILGLAFRLCAGARSLLWRSPIDDWLSLQQSSRRDTSRAGGLLCQQPSGSRVAFRRAIVYRGVA